jgi:hypothetical protein
MLRKLTAGMFAVALIFLVLGCSGDKSTAKKEKEGDGKGGDAKAGDPKGGDAGGGEASALMKDSIGLMNEYAEIIEGVKDKDTAEKAKGKFDDLEKKFKDLGDRLKKAKPTKEQMKSLEEKFKDDMEKAQKRMIDASKKLKPDMAKIILPATEKLQKTMMEAMPPPE